MTTDRWLTYVHERKFFVLLLALFLLAGLHPSVQGLHLGMWLFDLIFFLLLLATIFAVVETRQECIVALAFGIPALTITLVVKPLLGIRALPNEVPLLGFHLVNLTFFSYAGIRILAHVLKAERVTADVIAGAVCMYLLLAVIWSLLYTACDEVQQGAFLFEPALLEQAEAAHPVVGRVPLLLYYSFVTMTTLGYGDITPVSGAARTLSWMEAVLGQLYLVVLIARLVGLHIAQSSRKQ